MLVVVYVGRKYSAKATSEHVLPFRCVHCGHEAEANVIGIGKAEASSPLGLDDEGAAERAATAARTGTRGNAELTITLARCPKCRRRNEKALWLERARAAALALGAVLLLFGLLLLMDAARGSSVGLWMAGVGGLVIGPWIYLNRSYRWKTIEDRVSFRKRPRPKTKSAVSGS